MHWHIDKLIIDISNNCIYIPTAEDSCAQKEY